MIGTTTSHYGPVSFVNGASGSLQPVHSLYGSWDWPAMDVGTFGSIGAVFVGAQTANNNTGNNSCSVTVGAAHLFVAPFNTTKQTDYLFEPPTADGGQFGSAVALVPGYPFVLIGEHYRTLGTTTSAGQVYVYRKQ